MQPAERWEGKGLGRLGMGPALALSGLGSVLQTELLPRCGEIAPVGQVVHENGKVLLQAVLEVRDKGQLWALFLSSTLAETEAESPAAWVGCRQSSREGSAGSICSGRASVARLPAASWITSQKSSLP